MPQPTHFVDLYSLQILDSEKESVFDNIAELAGKICNTDQAYITFLDKNRQWSKAVYNGERGDLPLPDSFCLHAARLGPSVFIVDDPQTDSRFKHTAMVTSANGIRYYAGIAIVSDNGLSIGTLCVTNTTSHHLNDKQTAALKLLSKQVNLLLKERAEKLQLAHEKKQAEAKAKMQNLLLSLIAHELKTPVHNSLSLLNMFVADQFSETDFLEMAQISRRQLRHVAKAIDSLLLKSRKMLHESYNQKEFCHIQEALQQLADSNADAFAGKRNNVKIISSFTGEIFIDISGLSLLISNLMLNANNFTDNGNICIHIYKHQNTLKIEVSDTGKGMNIKTVNAINNGHFVNAMPGTNNEKGLGIGLLLARQYLCMTGGRLSVSSVVNEGSTFNLQIYDVQFVKMKPSVKVVETVSCI